MTDRQIRLIFKAFRDFVLFLMGTAILWHEVFDVDTSEPWVLAVGVAFCVSPGTIHLDRLFRRFLDISEADRDDKEGSG